MEKFKELSVVEMQEIDGGNMGSDFFASIGYYAHEVWCDIKKAYYDSKEISSLQGGDDVWAQYFGY